MHKIVFLDRSTLVAKIRTPNFQHEWVEFPVTATEETRERLKDASIAICNKTLISKDVVENLPSLQLIAIAATGTNNVDLQACKVNQTSVCNIVDYAQFAVSEHVFALALNLRRNLNAYRQDVLDGQWQNATGFCLYNHPIQDLRGSVLGIIGHGAIGKQTARIGEAFGMKVIIAEHKGVTHPRSGRTAFEEVIRHSDILSIHCPLNEQTTGLISKDELAQMKSTAILINTARGGIVDENALFLGLQEGMIAGAGFDVLSEEPPVNGHPLLKLNQNNFIMTPHVGWASTQAMQALADQLIDNIEAFVAGHPQNLVD